MGRPADRLAEIVIGRDFENPESFLALEDKGQHAIIGSEEEVLVRANEQWSA